MSVPTWQYLLVLLISYLVIDTIRVIYKPGLRKLPGPLFARFSKFWRVTFVFDGKCPSKYHALHQKYGPIVRTGPNSVDISDPAVIPTIYGINSKFLKVWFPHLNTAGISLITPDGLLRHNDSSIPGHTNAQHVLNPRSSLP